MKNELKTWLSVLLTILATAWILRYESITLRMQDRLESVEIMSQDTFNNVQKLNCQAMYGASACEDEYLEIPPYDDIETAIIEVIKSHESFRSSGYRDGCAVRKDGTCVKYRYSIGYGTREQVRGETITEEEATTRLKKHLQTHVYPYIPKTVKDCGVYLALADLGYNAGVRAMRTCVNFDGSLNIKEYQKWTRVNGKSNSGLEQRRKSTLIYALSLMDYNA